ncbi:MAG: helix-turn-helix domain-containing protein [Acidobacteria bacterium]|nr:helix-turn-helix domain-containing protein [Acidobacteriota bacterium]
MPKATVFRLLRTLEELGYLEYDSETESYQLTERLRQLGEPGLGPTLARLARPAMTRLVAEFEQTVNMATVEAGQLIYKDVQEGLRNVRMRPIPGVFLSWDKTALGKSILAFFPRDRAISLLRLTAQEIELRGKQVLWDELGRVRKTGFALDLEESEEGLCCVAAPILGQVGAPVAAMSVSGSSSVLTTRALPRIGARLVEECSAVSAALGYRGGPNAWPMAASEASVRGESPVGLRRVP